MIVIIQFRVATVPADNQTAKSTWSGLVNMYACLPVTDPQIKRFIRRYNEPDGRIITDVEFKIKEEV